MADALFNAAQKNDVASMKESIGRGVDVNGVDGNGCTALFWAAGGGFVECSTVLLEANADINKASGYGLTPLHIASYYGHVKCVKLLIDWKANVNAKDNGGYAPLHQAAEGGHLACVEMLIHVGAELDERNNYGHTPLVYAILNNKLGVAELLLDKGAKMSNVHELVEIPDWMNTIISKRENLRRSLTTFIGVLRKRFAVSGGGTEYTRGRLPREVVGVILKWAWSTRFDKKWAAATQKSGVEVMKSEQGHKCCK